MSNPTLDNQMELLRQQLARLERTKQETDARLARIGEMRADVAAVEARVTSPDRAVTVVAGPGGSVKDISFAEEARRLSPTQLSQATMATLRQAVAEAARRQAGVVQEHLGDNLDLVNRVANTQQAAFAQLGGTEPHRPASHSGRPQQDVTDEGESAPIMRREDW